MKKTKFRNYKLFKGFACSLAFIASMLLAVEMVATSNDSYSTMIDKIFHEQGSSISSTSLDEYAFRSDYDSATELIRARGDLAARISEEGCVLLKNRDNALPLRNYGEEKQLKVSMLGSRAFTYTGDGSNFSKVKRDLTGNAGNSFYGGLCGSVIYSQAVSGLDVPDGRLPIDLIDAFEEENIIVNPSNTSVYAKKSFPSEPDGNQLNGQSGGSFAVNEPAVAASEFSNNADYDDACFVVLGRMSGEGRDYLPGKAGIKSDDGSQSALNLSDSERNLIREAKKISDKVIVLLDTAIPMEIDELKKDSELADMVDAILWIGLPGSYGTRGVARIVSGSVSPSGSLPDTFAVDISASPASQNFGIKTQDGSHWFQWSDSTRGSYTQDYNGYYVVIAEGIYDGYYYYETRYADCIEGRGDAASSVGAGRNASSVWSYDNEISYSFGYGLSYSSFSVDFDGGTTYDAETRSLGFDVNVCNTGEYPAKKTVQLYLQSPYTDYDVSHSVEKSAIQLSGFGKTGTLSPGEQEKIHIDVPLKYIASYDSSVTHDGVNGGYILENAPYYFSLGDGAHGALNNVLLKKNAANLSKLLKEDENDADADASKVLSWNPAEENGLITQSGGTFDSATGINSSLLATSESGTLIQNQMEDADYNYFQPGSVTYLSRNDYPGTFPKSYYGLDATDEIKKRLDGGLYKINASSSKIEWGVDHSEEDGDDGETLTNRVLAQYKGVAYDDDSWDYLLDQIPFEDAHDFSPNGGSYCNAIPSVGSPKVWQIDGPNGNVTTSLSERASSSGLYTVTSGDDVAGYMTSDMPAEPLIAATFSKELLQEEGDAFAEEAIWDKNVICWAPGMNLHRTPWNSRGHEYYSEDPMLTNILGTSFVRGSVAKGGIVSPKHFAFNTQESKRQGLSQFMNEQFGREMELRAFEGVFEDVDYVNSSGNEINSLGLMTSFSRCGATNINSHTGVMKNILRGEFGFRGLSSSDYCDGTYYFNVTDAVYNNLTFHACRGQKWSDYENTTAVRNDPQLAQALRDNMHQYLYAIANSSALNGMSENDTPSAAEDKLSNWARALLIGGYSTMGAAVLMFGVYLFFAVELKKEVSE